MLPMEKPSNLRVFRSKHLLIFGAPTHLKAIEHLGQSIKFAGASFQSNNVNQA